RSDNRLPPSLSRATPSAAFEHVSELLGCPISRSLTTSCVCLELRPLPSTGITRLQRYCEPLRHPSAPGLSLAAVRLIIPITHWGFPCCVRFPCVHAAATTPVQRLGVVFARVTQPCQPSPEGVAGSACTSTFSRHARRSLALRPAHSRGHQFVTRYPKASDISSPPCLLRLLPAGAVAGWGLHPLESAVFARRTPKPETNSPCADVMKASRARAPAAIMAEWITLDDGCHDSGNAVYRRGHGRFGVRTLRASGLDPPAAWNSAWSASSTGSSTRRRNCRIRFHPCSGSRPRHRTSYCMRSCSSCRWSAGACSRRRAIRSCSTGRCCCHR